jgi:hypothetical protein
LSNGLHFFFHDGIKWDFIYFLIDSNRYKKTHRLTPFHLPHSSSFFFFFIPAPQPFPSLTQCYKFNTQACCVSGHDHKIKEDYGALLSPTCIREFSQLEYYMCLGCNSDQPKYVDDKKNVRICKKFADKLWTTDPTIYDTCGLNVPSLGLGYVLPSRYYTNASHFLNALKPPYFDDHTIVIAAEGETDNCLDSSAMSNMVSMVAVVAVSFASMLMM